jgi:hypothetical protein
MAHMFSLREMPIVSEQPMADAGAFILHVLLKLKEVVRMPVSAVESLGVVTSELQDALDFVFDRHLRSLPQVGIVARKSPLRALEPAAIMHQDSINMELESASAYLNLMLTNRAVLAGADLAVLVQAAERLVRKEGVGHIRRVGGWAGVFGEGGGAGVRGVVGMGDACCLGYS